MHFVSDNSGPAHPKVMEALVRANAGHAPPYGAEAAMERVRDRIRDLFEAPQAAVYLVATGTAANTLLLATLCDPWQAIYCSEVAHVAEDESSAPEFVTGGARLAPVAAPDGMIDPAVLRERIARTREGRVHEVQRGPLSLTSVTERGTVYPLARLHELTGVAGEFGLPVHLDGARLANALVALGCAPAEMARGVDAISFGGTKNGLLGVEAAVILDPGLAWEFELRRKRAGHLVSKHRYLSAQMETYLEGDLWLDMARQANAAARHLAEGLGRIGHARILHPVQANTIYAQFPRGAHRRLREAGAEFYSLGAVEGPEEEPVRARLVCDWSADPALSDRFLEILAG